MNVTHENITYTLHSEADVRLLCAVLAVGHRPLCGVKRVRKAAA